MYCIIEKSPTEWNIIGPFKTVQAAAEFAEKRFTPKPGYSAVITRMLDPKDFNPNGRRPS